MPRTVWSTLYMCCAVAVLVGGVSRRPAAAFSYHVSPMGLPGGDGSAGRPWTLAHALAGAGGRLVPGDTVWLRAGRYPGSFATALVGMPERHIVFRAWPGERATIDGTLRADGAYLTFWGFEIEQSAAARPGYGLEARTRGGRFVNLVIHDAGSMGVSFWSPAEDAELYGSVIYNNGTRDNLDHGVYVHNERGRKLLADNVLFNNMAYGLHVFAGANNQPQRDVRLEGNIVFNNGVIGGRYRAKGNILVGGSVPMSGMEVVGNVLYYGGRDGENLRLGFRPVPNGDALVTGNLIWGGKVALRHDEWPNARVADNVVGGGAKVVVRPNRYEPGRAFVAVYNPGRAPAVRVGLAGALAPGQQYEIRNVQDLYGAPVLAGTFSGDSLTLPMSGVRPPAPRRAPGVSPPRTAPVFDVFLVTSGVSAAPAPTGTLPSPAR